MKNRQGLKEAARFALTGGACFLVEFVCLVVLRDTCGLDTLLAVPLAFLVSVALNYVLCVRWVFSGAGAHGSAEKMGFLVTSLMGLLLNEGLMWVFRAVFGEDQPILTLLGFTVTMYMVNKALATLLVMIWNYFAKRAILKRHLLRRKDGENGPGA